MEFANRSELNFSSMSINALCIFKSKNCAGVDGFCKDGVFDLSVEAGHGIVITDELSELIERGVKESWFRVYDSSRGAIGYLFFVPWYAFWRLSRVQPVEHQSHPHVDPANFELFQIAVEIPVPQSLVETSMSS